VQTDGEAERHIPINADFFTGYRTTSIRPSDVVIAIFLPFTTSNQYIMSYKQSKRREDDLAIVSASFFVEIIDRVISCARLSYGGVSFKTVEYALLSLHP
jgi:xanthine dehydrogenase/oxidase